MGGLVVGLCVVGLVCVVRLALHSWLGWGWLGVRVASRWLLGLSRFGVRWPLQLWVWVRFWGVGEIISDFFGGAYTPSLWGLVQVS